MSSVLGFDGLMIRNMLRVFQSADNGTPVPKAQWLVSCVFCKVDREKARLFLAKCVEKDLSGRQLYHFYLRVCQGNLTIFIDQIIDR